MARGWACTSFAMRTVPGNEGVPRSTLTMRGGRGGRWKLYRIGVAGCNVLLHVGASCAPTLGRYRGDAFRLMTQTRGTGAVFAVRKIAATRSGITINRYKKPLVSRRSCTCRECRSRLTGDAIYFLRRTRANIFPSIALITN